MRVGTMKAMVEVAHCGQDLQGLPHCLRLQFAPQQALFFAPAAQGPQKPGQQVWSQFPAPVRTLEGAVRTLLHDLSGIGPNDYGAHHALKSLRWRGPYLYCRERGQRLLPCPAHVLARLGMPGPLWLAHADWLELLWGAKGDKGAKLLASPGVKQTAADLFTWQARRDAFYLQMRAGLCFELELYVPYARRSQGWELASCEVLAQLQDYLARGTRLLQCGMRQQLMQLSCLPPYTAPARPGAARDQSASAQDWYLVLITPADFGGGLQPQNFQVEQTAEGEGWRWQWAGAGWERQQQRQMSGFPNAADGRCWQILEQYVWPSRYEAGWDSARSRPRPARVLQDAGSSWRCRLLQGRVEAGEEEDQPQQIGLGRELGRGEFVLVPG